MLSDHTDKKKKIPDTCIYCDPTQDLAGTKNSPIYHCKKCGSDVVEFQCGCGSQRVVRKLQEQNSEFRCGELRPEANPCGERYSWTTCPSCLKTNTVFEPCADASAGQSEEHESDYEGFQCRCIHCSTLTQIGTCDQCDCGGRLMKVTEDGRQYCANCSPTSTESVGQHQPSERPAVGAKTGDGTHESQSAASMSLDTIRVQLETLNKTIDQFVKLQPNANDGTVWSILPRLHSKANELRTELAALESLPSEVQQIQDALLLFTTEQEQRQDRFASQNAAVSKSIESEIRELSQNLCGDKGTIVLLNAAVRKSHNTIIAATGTIKEDITAIREQLINSVEQTLPQLTETITNLQEQLNAVPAVTLAGLQEAQAEEQRERARMHTGLFELQNENKTATEKVQLTVDSIRELLSNAAGASSPIGLLLGTLQQDLDADREARKKILQLLEQQLSQNEKERQQQSNSSAESLTSNVKFPTGQNIKPADFLSELKSEIEKLVKSVEAASTIKSGKSLFGLGRRGTANDDTPVPAASTTTTSVMSVAPERSGPTFAEIQDCLNSLKASPGSDMLKLLQSIPDLFDQINWQLESPDAQYTPFDELKSKLLESIEGWQDRSFIERIPEEDVTKVTVQFDSNWHHAVSRQIVHDPNLDGTLASVQALGYRLVNRTADPIRLRRADVVLRSFDAKHDSHSGSED